MKAAKADYYPVFFFGIFGSLAEASNRDRFSNPFVFDVIHDDVVVPVAIGGLSQASEDGELEKQLNDIRQGKELALAGLRTLLGLEPDLPIELADRSLQPLTRETAPIVEYVNDAQQLRPEFTQAREGVKAFEALVKAAKADYYLPAQSRGAGCR